MLEIVTPAQHNRLTTVEVARDDLSLPASISDTRILRQIVAASGAIMRFCSRSFARERVRETIYAGTRYGPEAIRLSREPTEILSISVDTVPLVTDSFQLDGSSLYRLQAARRALWQGSVTVVEYNTGYILPGPEGADLPPEIERACVLEVGSMLNSSGRDPGIRSENVIGVGSITYASSASGSGLLHPESEGLLRMHVRGVIA